ncbi:MAG: DHH family phosphoesterase [Eubacteriales bacterium]|nr:DHH family phosphoesterase [Eubacteriales bacterium]
MKKNNKNKSVNMYFSWPFAFAGLMVLADIVMFAINTEAALILAIFTVVAVVGAMWLYFYSSKGLYTSMINFAGRFANTQKRMLDNMGTAALICNINGGVLWSNKAFKELLDKESALAGNILAVFPELTKDMLMPKDDILVVHSSFGSGRYRIEMQWGPLAAPSGKNDDVPEEASEMAIVAFITDETELVNAKQEIFDKNANVGIITVDNYDEALGTVDEVRRSMLIALVDRKLSNYFGSLNGLIRKLEKDKYIFFIMEKDFSAMLDDRFSVLDGVKTINIGNSLNITLSIGVGEHYDSYAGAYEAAKRATDMAMGRGGDQAVVVSDDGIAYFGGKSASSTKNTRVKARVKAQAFRELLDTKDKVIVMGHKVADVDAIGAAVGVWRIATALGKKAHVVNGNTYASVRRFSDMFSPANGYPEDFFVSGERAKELIDEDTLVVVVDVNRPSYSEAPELLKDGVSTVVIDHHRMSSEIIENPVLSYIEPYASSTCEMVAELLQYIEENIRLEQSEADILYAGIVLDTQNFVVQSGVRTFEAAAFLRKKGADVVRVRKLFREDITDYRAKAEAVNDAKIYKDNFAISVCNPDGTDSPTIIGAQAANSLLEISGIKAAVVLTPYNDKIFISARSIDEINVQVLMEKLGGGGHKSVAGAQLDMMEIDDATKLVTDAIDQMIEQGEVN